MSDIEKWLREWGERLYLPKGQVRDIAEVCALQHEALWMLLRLDMVAIDKEEVGWQHVQQLQDVGNAALKAAEDFQAKYGS